MKVGKFAFDHEANEIIGSINMRSIKMPYLILRKPRESHSENPPAYEIFEPDNMGVEVPVGELWQRTMRVSGQVFFGGNIDDPSFPNPLSIALFGDEVKGFEVKWRRDRAPQAAGGNGGGYGQQRRPGGQRSGGGFSGGSTAGPDGQYVGAGGDLDDDIPFD